jgi:4-aminobutyrate aminotransferase-like enzyme
LELVSDKKTRAPLDAKIMGQIAKTCEQRGVRVMACGRYGNVFRLMPPLVITRAHLDQGLDILIGAIKEAEGA